MQSGMLDLSQNGAVLEHWHNSYKNNRVILYTLHALSQIVAVIDYYPGCSLLFVGRSTFKKIIIWYVTVVWYYNILCSTLRKNALSYDM